MDIRLGTSADFAHVMERVATSFRAGNPGHLAFEELYPDSVSPGSMDQWRLAFVDGELAGGIQLVPRPLHLAGCVDLPAIGLGNVFCYPGNRGQGVMSALLQRCIADMREAGTAICLLGGDRTRYGHFGWEHCGTELRLSLSKQVRRHSEFAPTSVLALRVWSNATGDTDRMFAAYHRLPYHCVRSREAFASVLQRPGQVVWLCDDEAHGFAYASVRGHELLEYAGDQAAVQELLHFLLASGEFSAKLPPREHAGTLDRLMLDYARSFSVGPTAMGRVVCLFRLLRSFEPMLAERLQGWQGTLSVATEDGEAAVLRGTEHGLSIEPCPSDGCDLVLSRRDLALLLFGPIAPELGTAACSPAVRRAFPLPLFWHSLAHV